MKNYDMAKTMLNLLSILGWIVVLLGAVISIILLDDGLLVALSSGGVVCAIGFVNIAVAQMGLAQIDTAENTAEMKQMFEQLLIQSGVKTTDQTPAISDRPASLFTND
jgi:NADH:ubiquinone oxidoreductase subunit 4 (subunit M)